MKKLSFLIWIGLTWISYPILSLIAKKSENNLKGKRCVLVMPQLSRIGDIVCSTPVFYNIKKHYPESYISILISRKALGIVKNNKRIDEFIIIEDYSWFSLIRKIRDSKFNWSINLTATSVNTCLSVWGNIPNRIKTVVEEPPITEKLTDWMSNHNLLYRNHTYLPGHNLKLLKFIGIDSTEDKKEVWLSDSAENKAELWNRGLPQGKKIIGLSITAGNKIKELGDEKFEIIIKKILESRDVVICCIGSKTDSERIDKLVRKIRHPSFFGETSFNLEELPSLIKRFALYIAVDTGPVYIAHALGIPIIDIIGPVDPNEQPPKDESSVHILPRGNHKPSSFVFKKRGLAEDIKKAIEATEVEDVVEAAIALVG